MLAILQLSYKRLTKTPQTPDARTHIRTHTLRHTHIHAHTHTNTLAHTQTSVLTPAERVDDMEVTCDA